MQSFFKRYRTGIQVIVILFLCAIYIVPQISQQLLNDALPATGDLVHRRTVYLLTNFPSTHDAPALISAHSQFYHEFIASVNILTGLTGNKAFYGMTLVNLLMLPFASLVLFILARRINRQWAFIAPLFFMSYPNLVLLFFGHTNQHLLFIFLGLAIFVILNLSPSIATKMLAVLFLGVTLNGSLTTWFPIILVALIIELFYPAYRTPLLFGVATLLYLPFLSVPISYLAFGDYSGTLKMLPRIAALIAGGIFSLALFYRFMRHHERMQKYVLVSGGVFATLLFFMVARTAGPFSGNVRPEDFSAIKDAVQSSIDLADYLFVVNLGKGIVGYTVYEGLVLFIFVFGFIAYLKSRTKMNLALRVISSIVFIPVVLALLRLILLNVAFDYFSRSPLWNLHPGRILLITFFLLPLILVYCLFTIRSHITRWAFVGMGALLIVNIALISLFSAERIIPGWSQKQYQRLIQNSLEQGIGENLSAPEGFYACQYYKHCDVQFTGGSF